MKIDDRFFTATIYSVHSELNKVFSRLDFERRKLPRLCHLLNKSIRLNETRKISGFPKIMKVHECCNPSGLQRAVAIQGRYSIVSECPDKPLDQRHISAVLPENVLPC